MDSLPQDFRIQMMDMGNFPSKDIHDCLGTGDLSLPVSKETPVRIRVLDPRSPSEGIPRTPIEFVIKKSAESGASEDIDSTTPDDLLRKRSLYSLSKFDPRSPTLAFERTPVQIAVRQGEDNVLPQLSNVSLPKIHAPQSKPGKLNYNVNENCETGADACNTNEPEDLVLLSDPRSPSADISRTPIQVTEEPKQVILHNIQSKPSRKGLLETDLDAETNKIDFSTYRGGNKSTLESKNKQPDRHPCVTKNENSSDREKENELSLKRKLFLTPDSSPVIQAGLKVRNPLGIMSNYQQSPSLLLKMKQSWKIEQSARAVIYDLEKTPNSKYPCRNEKQATKQPIVEWDKDSTVLI
ncbi:cell division cycle-associated protein 3 [Anabrus simplex]|uniref:cell division cycle-associated protein 3 n=1 Tax=Anabrus simplex TaxID=316456 RepID=UPI0035A29A19